jgi:hypothetical protein
LYTLVVRDLPAFSQWAKAQNIWIVRSYQPAAVVLVEALPADFIGKILPHPLVLYADRGARSGQEELAVPGQNLFVNRINAAHQRWPDLDGRGMTVSIKEFRFDSLDVDLKGRYVLSPHSASQLTDHAFIMASLVGGAGNSDPAGRGVARGARLSSSSFAGLLPDDAADYVSQNTTVQNHSYGSSIENYYGPSAMAYDYSVSQRPALVHVFSAGNDGQATAPSGIYAGVPGFANLTGNFKMAKNVLTVGSVDSFGRVLSISARGPAYDGRIKPDLMAFGPNGTSEAAALVSGASAVLQQAFVAQYGILPPAAAIRAGLLNTADDIPPAGPDFASGFGNMNLKNALKTIVNRQLRSDSVETAGIRTFPIAISSNIHDLRVTLAWDDPPGSPGTDTALVNDLDLIVVAPDGSFRRPWVLNTAPSADALLSPAGRGRDSLNNVEQVTVDFPVPGVYQIQVQGHRILSGNQAFTFAFRMDTLGRFEWDCPVHNDPAVVGQEAILRWSTNRIDSIGRIEWKPVGAPDWRLIDAAAPLAAGSRRWLVPDTFTAAQVRMIVGTQIFPSDTFLVSKVLRMRVGFDCADSVLVRWNAAAPGAIYRLWGLGDRYLEPLLTTADTFLVLQKKDFPSQRYTVSAFGHGGVEGPKSPAPDIATQGAGCFISNFLAELKAGFQTDLTLQIGTTYGVQKVYLEKVIQGGSEVLFEALPTLAPIMYTDLTLQPGINRYFARVDLINGAHLRSDTLAVYFTGTSTIRVFPNPAQGGGFLTILSKTPNDAVFTLYDALGRRILQQTLTDQWVDIVLPALPPGGYWWRVIANGERSGVTGRIVVAMY